MTRSTILFLLAFLFGIHAACTAQADSPRKGSNPPPVKATPPAKPAPTAEERARTVIEKQLKALPTDRAAFFATLSKEAVVMLPNFTITPNDPDLDLGNAVADLHPDSEMISARLVSLVAGGNTSMVWLAAELEIVVSAQEPGEPPSRETRTVRAVELLDAASGWRVVAASFSLVRPLDRRKSPAGPISSPTTAGPLVPVLAAPDKLASLLSMDPVVVFGSDKAERAVGHSSVKVLLSKWRKLPLAIEEADNVREVRTPRWGFAMAHVNLPKPGGPPYRMSAFLVAVPRGDGRWEVVAVNYGAL